MLYCLPIALLFTTPPTLSTDVYRYIWDGRMMNAGVNPYAHPVDSPLLDRFDSPQRALVNHSWMASPYLPVAQAFFAAVYRLAPDSPLSFQVAAALLDLLTGLLVIDLLHRLGLPRTRALIYLWNPLVIVEFAHGAHLDALLTYLDPANPRESDLVRLVEYVPLYVLLIWSAWPASGGADGPGAD